MCPSTCTQNLDNTTVNAGVICNCPFGDTSYIRLYDPTACGLSGANDFVVDAVNFGIESALDSTTGTGMQAANIRLYSYTPGTPFTFGFFTLLHDQPISIADTTLSFMCVEFCPVRVPAGQQLVAELYIPPANMTGGCGDIIPGANLAGATDPWYLASSCGLLDPLSQSGDALLLDVSLHELVGTSVCSPALPNSTGGPASILGIGSLNANVTLRATCLPPNEMGYFLASDAVANTPFIPPGSSGNFCLGVGSSLGRYSQDVRDSGPGGAFSLAIDPTAVPWGGGAGAGNPLTIDVTGLTWYFSCWYRDGATTNFTDVFSITFLP